MCNGQLTHGENLIVAIASWGGYNQEDGLIINQTSVERGMLNVSVLSTVSFDEDMSWDKVSSKTVIANPLELTESHEVEGIKTNVDYTSIASNGLPQTGEWIDEGRALLGMCHLERVGGDRISGDKYTVKDVTQVADRTFNGRVDKVYVTDGPVGTRTCKIRFREVRQATLGDKMASRFGSKGVVGMLLPGIDMPFAEDGTVPDVIINPHGFPKRMTIGHILEALLGRVACHMGRRLEATTFDGVDPINVAAEYFMSSGKWTTNGDTVLYNGRTGEQVPVQMFMGVNYYNRLKHMSVDKINYRSTGSKNFMTRQATQGRGNGGGLKVGEMEQHCIIAHGAATFLKESFFDRSDPFHVHIDEHTGQRPGHREGTALATGVSAVLKTPMPYSFKQLTQELETMSIGMRMSVGPEV